MAVENVESPMAGKITKINAGVGSHVEEGDAICVLESMKMENLILAPVSGTIQAMNVAPNQVVQSYDVVAVIEF